MGIILAIGFTVIDIFARYKISTRDVKELEDPEFAEVYGSLYSMLKTKNLKKTLGAAFARKFSIIGTIVLVENSNLQIILLHFVQSAWIIFFNLNKPMKSWALQRIKMFNEIMLSASILYLLVLLQTALNPESHYYSGYG